MNLHWLTSVTNGQLRSLFQCQTMSLITVFLYARLLDFLWIDKRFGKTRRIFSSLWCHPFCYYIKPEMSLRDYRKSKVEKKSFSKKSFEISTALVLQMKILEFSPKCINFFCNFKVKKRCIEFSCLCVLPSVRSQSLHSVWKSPKLSHFRL